MRLRLDEIKLIHECVYTPDVVERVFMQVAGGSVPAGTPTSTGGTCG